jgi:PKD repeat protein
MKTSKWIVTIFFILFLAGTAWALAAPVASFTAVPTSGIAPLKVQFTDTSTGTPTRWSWGFGDGTTSAAQNPSHTYNRTGTYTVRLTVRNAAGSSIASTTIKVTVALPVASFTATPTSGAAPLTVQFTDTSTGSISSRSWTFGDGGSSTLRTPIHTYTNSGTFTVTLTVRNAGGSSSATAAITVGAPALPVASFTANPTSGPAPLAVKFTNTSTGSPTSWSWTFGDGGTSTTQNPSHTYASSGTYTVTLTVRNAGGSSNATTTINVTVAAPVASFTANPTSGPAPLAVQFTDKSTGSPTSWSWTFGDGGSSTAQNPSHTYTSSGTYTVTLTATNAGGSSSANATISVKAGLPVASFTANPPSGPAPLAVQFTDTSTGNPTSWSWTFGDGTSSTAQNPSHTYNGSGTYGVSLTVTNSGGSSNATGSIVVSAMQPPVANFTATPTSGAAPLKVQFTDTSTGSPTSWSWAFGDGGTSTTQNPSYTYAKVGTFTAKLTVSNANGSTSKTSNLTVTGSGGTISPWGGRVSICFDDGDYASLTVWPDLCKSYSIVGTVFPIAGWIGNGWECTWDQLQSLVQDGWEIGNHTMDHQDLTTLTGTQLDYEIGQAKQILEQNLGVKVTSIATPGGTGTDNKLVMQYISKFEEVARNVSTAANNYFPFAPYNMFSWPVEYNVAPTTVIQTIQDAMAKGYWLVLTFHVVGSSGAQGMYPTANLAQILQYLQTNAIPMVTLNQGMAFTQGPNLVQNSDFTSTDSTGWATNWTRIGSAANVSLQTVSPFPRVFAPGPLWLELQSASSGTTIGATSDPIPISDTTVPYFLSFFIDSTIQSGSVSIIAQELNSNGQQINSQQLGSLGTNYNASWSVAQTGLPGYMYQASGISVSAVRISVQANFTGAANFDHFFFGTLPAKPN